ncbi:hypothetical protein Adt_20051 [Abeliophyllum distichum]|uniref:Uncharacterized protein n=1 Tax=Abeliophyllum distichum TaxID=126358 RepID=A0ABD1SUN5_9LAMI
MSLNSYKECEIQIQGTRHNRTTSCTRHHQYKQTGCYGRWRIQHIGSDLNIIHFYPEDVIWQATGLPTSTYNLLPSNWLACKPQSLNLDSSVMPLLQLNSLCSIGCSKRTKYQAAKEPFLDLHPR